MRTIAVSMAAVLATFGSAVLIEHLAHLHTDVVILAVVLAMTLGRRASGHSPRARVISFVLLPAVCLATTQLGSLLVHHPNVGDALFVIGVSGAIWLRRFGPAYARAGTLITLPFIALLITPVPALSPSGSGSVHTNQLWGALMGLVALSWVNLAQFVDRRLFPAAPVLEPLAPQRPRSPAASAPKKLPASTRMAAQMAVALAAAFAVGRAIYPHHWSWLVITAYIVGSGNRGRGDVVYKSVLRLAGAGLGTVVATLVAGHFPAGDKTPIVIIFVVLAVAGWLRTINYAYWAAGITSVLALLNGYFGESGTAVLRERLVGVALGAVIAVAAAWFVLPIKTIDVVRRRIADTLYVLGDYLRAHRTPEDLPQHHQRVTHALGQLEQVAPAVRAHRRLPAALRGPDPHVADTIDGLLLLQPEDRSMEHVKQQIATAKETLARLRAV